MWTCIPFAFVVIFLGYSEAALNPLVGVVEGFYWEQVHSVNGQWGQYSLNQRLQLISLLATNGLGIYWWAPQKVNTIAPWTTAEASGWTETVILSKSVGVKVIYGLRPGWLSMNFNAPLAKIAEVRSAGIRSYSLNFDDAEGVATEEQQQREVNLAAAIQTKYPDMELATIVPYCYHQDCSFGGSMTKWSATMATIDKIPQPSAAMVTTGAQITPGSMKPVNFPKLTSGRRNMFWDNWNAEDTNTQLPWGLGIRNQNIRDPALFTNPYGYFMNLAFPLERIVHQIHCMGKLASKSTCTSTSASAAWVQWLADNGFLHGKSIPLVQAALQLAIDEDTWYEDIHAMETARPTLAGIFSIPPAV